MIKPREEIGSKKDIALAEKVVAVSQGKALSVAGNTTLGELVALMRGAKMVISNDSGPMHIAAGFNIPVVAIFGPTSPQRTGPGRSPVWEKEKPTIRVHLRIVSPGKS